MELTRFRMMSDAVRHDRKRSNCPHSTGRAIGAARSPLDMIASAAIAPTHR